MNNQSQKQTNSLVNNNLKTMSPLDTSPLTTVLANYTARAQKIVTALYMLTNLITENDPIREALRKQGTQMLGHMHTSIHVLNKRHEVLVSAHVTLQEIDSYLQVAYNSGFFSEMNYRVISNELNSFAATLSGSINDLENKKKKIQHLENLELLFTQIKPEEISETVAQVSHAHHQSEPLTSARHNTPEVINRHQSKPIDTSKTTETKNTNEVVNVSDQKDTITKTKPKIDFKKELRSMSVKKAPLITRKKVVRKPKTNEAKESRKLQIMNILSSGETSPITDIYDEFKNCSSKTIQRDLGELIDEGKVLKQGSRRWSTYSLA